MALRNQKHLYNRDGRPMHGYAYLSDPAPEWATFCKENSDIIPNLEGEVAHSRESMGSLKARAAKMVPVISEDLSVQEILIATTGGSRIPLRIYIPTTSPGPFPCVIYFHGGGWCLGDLDGEDNTCRVMCTQTTVVVVSVGYRLAPENPFPAANEDAWAALRWVIAQATSIRVNEEQIILGGSSAGANLAAVLSHRAGRHQIRIHGQILRMPVTCHHDCYPPEFELLSIEQNKNAPILSKSAMEGFYKHYNPPQVASVDVSPLLAPSFEQQPPTYLQIAGLDPLRDEGFAYGTKLRQGKVPTIMDVYPGVPHAFSFFPELTVSRTAGADLIRGLRWLIDLTLTKGRNCKI